MGGRFFSKKGNLLFVRKLQGSHGGRINQCFSFGGEQIQKAELIRQSRGSGLINMLLSSLDARKKYALTEVVITRGESIRERVSESGSLKPLAPYRGMTPLEMIDHTNGVELNKGKSFSEAGFMARWFGFFPTLHGSRAVLTSIDTRGLRPAVEYMKPDEKHMSENWALVYPPSPYPIEFENLLKKSCPPCNLIGYQNTVASISTGHYVFNELYVDPNIMPFEYPKLHGLYIRSFQAMLENNWSEKASQPQFNHEGWNKFIELNVNFYTEINKILAKRVGEKVPENNRSYNLTEVKKAFEQMYEVYNESKPVPKLK